MRRGDRPAVERGGALDWASGAFVTIHHRGDLRGCLGRLEPGVPLGETIIHLAEAVSDSDPRFAPVSYHELTDIVLEVSVLMPAQPVTRIEEIEVGRHGVIIEHGARRGLLLPQVASEHGWDRETLLEHACRKAMLAPDAWVQGASIFIFEAEVFGEVAG